MCKVYSSRLPPATVRRWPCMLLPFVRPCSNMLLLRLADWWYSSATSVPPPAATRWFMIVHGDVRSTATPLLRNSVRREVMIYGVVGNTAPPLVYASLIDDTARCCRWQSTSALNVLRSYSRTPTLCTTLFANAPTTVWPWPCMLLPSVWPCSRMLLLLCGLIRERSYPLCDPVRELLCDLMCERSYPLCNPVRERSYYCVTLFANAFTIEWPCFIYFRSEAGCGTLVARSSGTSFARVLRQFYKSFAMVLRNK
jgi:hypothetical protein